MNYIAHRRTNNRVAGGNGAVLSAALRRYAAILLLLAGSGCAVAAVDVAEGESDAAAEKVYGVTYTVTPDAKRGTALVEMRVEQSRRLLREITMRMPEDRFSDFSGDGEIIRENDELRWLPASNGGELRWTVQVPHRRYGNTFDAWLGKQWGLFRASDIIPPAGSRTVVGAQSRTRLQFDLPKGWSAVTQFAGRRGVYSVPRGERRFNRPTGWILIGKLGVRIETIAGVRVVVAGPKGQGVRRLDMLALLHWTLPQLTKVLPDFPKRLAIVSAKDGMWRGGLSGPGSLYIHASLPLISENATSTLLHEVIHIGSGLRAASGADWIVEGLAEYYALEILRRSRSISQERFDDAIKELVAWGKQADNLCAENSTAAITARAVGIFAALQRELRASTKKTKPLDEVLRALVATGDAVTVSDLRETALAANGGSAPRTLSARNLPGCT
ncbi:MAG: hypothetical protein HKP32_05080 [Woeseia sp.]|nr:hypothetical protein [Woeseia sp.]NNL54505.1 hypothetical protein [Woeseia sp.]